MKREVSEDDLPLQCMYRWERERAQRVFLTQPFGGGKVREWTWADAMGEARRMAAYLKDQGWEPGSRVAILARNCAWWVMADMAIWMAGFVSVPIYPSLKPQTIRQILEHSEARACFLGATDDREMMAEGIPAGVPVIAFQTAGETENPRWDDVVFGRAPLAGNHTRPPDDLATIIYTSGTTGAPKGVMHCFAAFAVNVRALAKLLNLDGDERLFSYLPLAHIVERVGVEGVTYFLGARIFFTEGIETFLADLRRARPTLFLSVPRLLLKFQQGVFAKMPQHRLERLLRFPVINHTIKKRILRQLGLDTVRLAACGAAPLPAEILMWYRNLGLQLEEGYGMTETMITHLPAPGTVRPGYVGAAVPGVDAKLGDNDELLIRSPMNLLGYFKDLRATQDAFTPDGFFRTGDMASIAPDGQLKIIGRVKEQFKTSKGKYVAPAPIESRLVAHPAVEACCLMGAGMPSPFAIIVLTAEARQKCGDSEAREEIRNSLWARMEEVNAQLDPHERVAFLAIVDGPWTVGNGLITPTLKIKRAALENLYHPMVDQWRTKNTPVVWDSAA